MHEELGKPETWINLYQNKTDVTDWFVKYDQLKEFFEQHLSSKIGVTSVILDIGCGSSEIGPRLSQDFKGTTVYCMDVSHHCLQLLSEQYNESLTTCSFVVGDVRRKIPLSDRSVDYVIDKGTYDAVHRHKEGMINCKHMLEEINRVLKPGCIYFLISGECPGEQMSVLHNAFPHASVSYVTIQGDSPFEVYAYTITKAEV